MATVIWEYTGRLDTCEMSPECYDRAEYIVQAGQPTSLALPTIRRSCYRHVPAGSVAGQAPPSPGSSGEQSSLPPESS